MNEEILQLVSDRRAAAQSASDLFGHVAEKLAALLPSGSIIEHVGATAIADCETKGDLDIAVRVNSQDFDTADCALAAVYSRNPGSIRTDAFSAFEDADSDPHLGVQLVVVGSQFDVFHLFRDRLAANPALVVQYNALKRQWQNRPMEDYRRAKAAFVERVIAPSS